ncbi:hypothetical protein QFC22_003193 [Naganishia vaughanmartiniae]|uniref:Uncharacterized protein n=1 Tax=Naganishia vaughanmartiniae TaxID=1424756 RepID=A0ACC2X8D9_9TREE|nr:hypothetical protein QFC22_003193 [Naganishia vaughanmartiniae]
MRITGQCLIFSPTALIAKALESAIVENLANLSLQDSGTSFVDTWSLPAKASGSGHDLKAPEQRNTGRPSSWDPDAPAVPDADAPAWGPSETPSNDLWGAKEEANGQDEGKSDPSSSGWGNNKGALVSARPSRPISQEVMCINPADSGLVTPADSLQVPTPVTPGNANEKTITLNFETKVEEESKKPGNKLRQTEHLGRGYLTVKTRRRVTVDGGRSLLATETTVAEKQGMFPTFVQSLFGLTFAP